MKPGAILTFILMVVAIILTPFNVYAFLRSGDWFNLFVTAICFIAVVLNAANLVNQR